MGENGGRRRGGGEWREGIEERKVRGWEGRERVEMERRKRAENKESRPNLSVSELELDVGVPALFLRLPLHPPLKDLPHAREVL